MEAERPPRTGFKIPKFFSFNMIVNPAISEVDVSEEIEVTESKQSPPIIASEPRKQSSLVTIFVLWNTMVGTSLLAMPWGVERAGLIMGVILPIVMGALCCYTAYCNVATQAAYGPAGGEISELTRHMLGPRFEFLSKLFSYIVLLGALIVYWILMSNFLYFTVDYIYTATTGGFKDIDTFELTGSEICLVDQVKSNITADLQPSVFKRVWNLGTVPIYLIVLLAPLLSFKSATFFTKFNSLGTMSLVYLMVFVVVKALSWGFNLDLTNPSSVHYSELVQPSFFATSGTLAMSYYMHNIIITVMRSNKNQRNNARDVAVGYGLGTGTYLIVGSLFYISFPLAKTCIEDNMLNNFASWDVLTLVARMFLFFQLTTVYPLINYMLRYQVMTAFFSSPYPSLLHVLIFNLIVVVSCVLFAVFLPRIGTVIRFTGAISGCFHVFTLPCLLKLAGQKQSGELSIASLIIHLAIPVLGFVNLVAQFFVSDS
ncbi:sodium-coupled neutral amino acid transporter 9 homolog isoform X1 [Homalodisca vitripennis]|uniref:sodium-coupled neutral amino acid transporter 9 homolog isoform X1 n=1 Tax=Homalodisca vitripennis TaxID=197043 RepID=UPI001EEB0F77|nr:sodium-coupled neutral amino acid transporter 9 homolog isoform X1 [Homalodisca vitripennis]